MMAFTCKKVYHLVSTTNSPENLLKRKQYVESLQQYMEEGVNLFCRRTYGRAKKGKRSVSVLPSSKGPNIRSELYRRTVKN